MPRWTSEQQLAIDKENTNIIVSAGAGSGKTAVLTARVIRKLKSGVNVNELLILTFTNKAAHEMKERIRKAIEKDDSLKEQLDYIDNSYITTFDSFALSVVKKYNYLLNISKSVKIADSSIIYLEKKKILDEIFDSLYEKKDVNFLKLLDDFTIKDDKDIKQYVLDINDKLDLKYNKKEYLENYISNYYNDENITSLVEEYLNMLLNNIKKVDKLLTEFGNFVDSDYLLEVSDILSPLLNSDTYDEIRKNVLVKFPNLPRGSADEAKSIKKEISELLSKLEYLTRFEDILDIKNILKSTESYVSSFIFIMQELDKKIEIFKNKNNVYEFTDISKMAIRILKENDFIKEEMKYFFKEIMIDEYQDTSDLQEEFISMIENNNVYMVGDIKQSIYRFRNANPYLFKNKYDRYSNLDGGFKIDLTKNFRSRLEVIDNVNLFFSYLMNNDLGGADYKASHKMIFGNNTYIEEGATKQNNNIEIFNYEFDKESPYTKEEIEIFFIANDIKKKVEEKYQIFDKDNLVLRDARFGDFAILLDKSTNFDLYKKIFEYIGIPMTKYTTTNITNEIEIVLIKNILNLIISCKEKKYDVEFKYSFTSIARSYLFSYSDQEIFNYFLNNNYLESDVMKVVLEIINHIDSVSLGDLIIEIIDKFDFYSKQILVGDVKNRINRLSSIVDTFKNLADIGYDIYNTYDYLSLIIEDKYKLEVKDLDVLDNSVKIMTIHASKGLEFPICYFASLHSKFNIRELNEKFLYSNKYEIITPYFKEGIGKTFIKDLVKENYINEEISEKIRLFYVALTRAKEKMIMVTSIPSDNKNIDVESSRSFLDMILCIKEYLSDYIKEVDLNKILITKDYNLIKKYNYKENIEKISDVFNVSELNIEEKCKMKNKISKEVLELTSLEVKDKLEFGINIHGMLEHLDFINPDLEKFDMPNIYKNNIKKFLNDLKLEHSLSIYKEYEFICDDDSYEHGFIDLIVEYNDHIKIIDYKLKNIKDDGYIKQLNSYKSYISKKTNKGVEIYLFSIVDGVMEKIG